MLDVHIIKHPTQDRSATLEPLLEQLESEPVVVHLVDGVDRLIGDGRFRGYQCGELPLVSYLDDDDEIIPGIFDKILQAFEEEPRIDGVGTREQKVGLKNDRMSSRHYWKYYSKRHFLRVHHITAYRRASIADHIEIMRDCPTSSEHTLVASLMLDNAIIRHIPVKGYVWRQHAGSITSLGMVEHPKSQKIYKEVFRQAQKFGLEKCHIEGQEFIDRAEFERWQI